MSFSSVSESAARTAPAATSDTRLRGRWLLVARVGTILLALASVVLFSAMLPAIMAFLETPCADGSCPLTPAQAQALGALGLTPGDYATFNVALMLLGLVPSLIIAAILFWRRSDDWMALLFVLLAVNPSNGIIGATGIWQTPALLLHAFGVALFYLTFSLFPSGRFVPRWTRWFVIGWAAFTFAPLFISLDNIPNWLLGPLYFVFYANLLFSQGYRYWRVSGALERQQTKWVVFGLMVALLANVAYWQPYAFIPALATPDSLYAPLCYPIYQLIFAIALSLSLGIAILRYRLWDIDAIINKTLVYGVLTALLGVLYAGFIIGLEHMVGLFGGTTAQNPLALVISTLAIAALFQPLRKRIQAIIDRRFYRKKYDAEKTLAAFSAALRNEVDLAQLREHLLTVVQETMQPAHVSLWLQPSGQQWAQSEQAADEEITTR